MYVMHKNEVILYIKAMKKISKWEVRGRDIFMLDFILLQHNLCTILRVYKEVSVTSENYLILTNLINMLITDTTWHSTCIPVIYHVRSTFWDHLWCFLLFNSFHVQVSFTLQCLMSAFFSMQPWPLLLLRPIASPFKCVFLPPVHFYFFQHSSFPLFILSSTRSVAWARAHHSPTPTPVSVSPVPTPQRSFLVPFLAFHVLTTVTFPSLSPQVAKDIKVRAACVLGDESRGVELVGTVMRSIGHGNPEAMEGQNGGRVCSEASERMGISDLRGRYYHFCDWGVPRLCGSRTWPRSWTTFLAVEWPVWWLWRMRWAYVVQLLFSLWSTCL